MTERGGRNENLHDMNNSSPTAIGIPVYGCEQSLRDCFEKILRLEVRGPKAFAHSKQGLGAGSGDDEIGGKISGADEVLRGDKGLIVRAFQSGNHGFREIGSKSWLIKNKINYVDFFFFFFFFPPLTPRPCRFLFLFLDKFYGNTNLFSYNIAETRFENEEGLMSRSSFNLYMLILNCNFSWLR